MFDYLPEQGSTIAVKSDMVNHFISLTMVASFLVVAGTLLVFIIKYRDRGDNRKVSLVTGDSKIELMWTLIPSVFMVVMMFLGFYTFNEMRDPPVGAEEIQVIGQKWQWNFKYDNGKEESNNLVVPINQPIKLVMKSKDVLHSFSIPAFRIKEDVAANLYTYEWFEAIKLGEYDIWCTEYCGLSHSEMIGKVKVVTQEEYVKWKEQGSADAADLLTYGAKLHNLKGCVACHTTDGSPRIGPSFKGLWGKNEEFEGGTKAIVDENYVRESLLKPQAKVVKGFANVMMQSFDGQLDDNQINAIIVYLKSLK